MKFKISKTRCLLSIMIGLALPCDQPLWALINPVQVTAESQLVINVKPDEGLVTQNWNYSDPYDRNEYGIQLAQASNPPEIQVHGIKIVEYGIFDAQKVGDAPQTGTALGTVGSFDYDSLVLIEKTQKIKARLNKKFGIRYILNGAPFRTKVPITIKVLSPGMKNPNSESVSFENAWSVTKEIGAITYDGFVFEHDWEMVSGKWVIQVFNGFEKLGEQEFEVVKDAENTDIPRSPVDSSQNLAIYIQDEIKKVLSPDCEARLTAVYQLKSLGNKAVAAIPAIIKNLRTYSPLNRIDFDCGAGKATPGVLASFGEPAIQPLIVSLGEPIWEVQIGAKEALIKIGPAAIDSLLQALREDSNLYIRAGAAEVLALQKDERVISSLFEIMQNDPLPGMRRVIIKVFVELKDPRAIKPLMEIYMKKDENIMVRYDALEALHKIADRKKKDMILSICYSEEDPDIKPAVIEFLSNVNTPDSKKYLLKCLNDEKAYIRSAAVLSLGKIKYKNTEPLIKLADDSDSFVRKNTAIALGESGNQKAVKTLMILLNDQDRFVRLEAIRALAKLKALDAVEPLVEIIKSGKDDHLDAAIIALGDINDPRANEVILGLLNSKSLNIRRSAVEAAGRAKAVEAVAPLIALLKKGSDRSFDVVAALAEIGGPAVRPLIEASRGERADSIRRDISESLYKIGQASVEDLIAALKDRDKYVVETAVSALGKIKSKQAIMPLIEKLDQCSPGDCSEIAYALGSIGKPAVDPLLEKLKQKNTHHQNAIIVQALGTSQDKRAVQPLVAVLKEGNSYVNQFTTEALGRIGNKKAVMPLVEALKDKSDSVRSGAAEALGKMQDPRAYKPLMELLKSDPQTRFRSIEAIGKLKDRRATKTLCAFLKDMDTQLQIQSCKAIGEIGDKRAVASLIEVLNDKKITLDVWKVLRQITQMDFRYNVDEWKKWFEREKRKKPSVY